MFASGWLDQRADFGGIGWRSAGTTRLMTGINEEIAIGSSDRKILQGAVMTGIINAVINSTIQWYLLADKGPLPLTVDGITNDAHTVFGAAVPLAVSLAMILTAVGYTTVKGPKPPFFPVFLWMTVKHGFFALGVVITFAVLWQRFAGSIVVTLPAAVIILGLVAGMAAGIVNYMTIKAAATRAG